MSVTRPVLVVLTLAALVGAAPAAPEWHTFGAGKALAQEQGRPTLLFFDLGDENSELFLKVKFPRPEVQQVAKDFVLIRIPQGSQDLWRRYGIETGPAVRVCDSEGTVLEKGYWRSAEALSYALKAARRKFGPIMPPADRARADALSKEIDRALVENRYAGALAAANELTALTDQDPYAKRAVLARKRLAVLSGSHLERGETAEKAGRLYEASVKYEEVVAMFPGLPAAGRAAAHLARFSMDPKIRKAVKTQRRVIEAATALAAANEKDAKRPDLALREWRRIAADWPETKAGQEASRLSRARYADPAAMKRVRQVAADQICPGRLSMARTYIKNGLPAEARPLLEEVLEKHSGTTYEEKARKLLNTLR